MSKGPVSVFVEHEQGKIKMNSLEMLGKAIKIAEQMGVETVALVCGDSLDKITQDLAKTGVNRVCVFEKAELTLYQPLVYARLLTEWAEKEQPEAMWFSCSSIGVDLAARVAAKLETGLTAHCVGIDLETVQGKEVIVHSLPGWGGNFIVKIICPEKRPQMATVRPGICEPAVIGRTVTAKVERTPIAILDGEMKIKALEDVQSEKGTGGLEQAEVVVAGGWGLRSSGSLEPIYKLAKVLKAEVGGTRPLVDCGWLEETRMIGISGKSVTPKLFISVAASGQPHYTTGFDKAGVIFCINNDAKAPLFSLCDLGIIGDYRRILPELTAKLEGDSYSC